MDEEDKGERVPRGGGPQMRRARPASCLLSYHHHALWMWTAFCGPCLSVYFCDAALGL